MHIRPMTKANFDYLLAAVDDWWGRLTAGKLHPVYLYQFGDTAFAAEEDGRVIGFVVGFVAQTDPTEVYAHLVGTRPGSRRRGVARALYRQFFATVASKGCRQVKAIMVPINRTSLAFHQHMGFRPVEQDTIDIDGVKPVKDYSEPGEHRVVLVKELGDGPRIGCGPATRAMKN